MSKHLTSHLSQEDLARLSEATEIAAKRSDAIRDDIERRLKDGEVIPGWELGATNPKPRWGRGASELLAAIKAEAIDGATIPECLKNPHEVLSVLRERAPHLVTMAEAAIERPPGQPALRKKK